MSLFKFKHSIGNVTPDKVLADETFSSDSGLCQTGTMEIPTHIKIADSIIEGVDENVSLFSPIITNAKPNDVAYGKYFMLQDGTQGVGTNKPVVINFYDWDGVTFLGATTAPTDNEADLSRTIQDYTMTLMSKKCAEAYDGNYDVSKSYFDPNYPLCNKKGYTFKKWLNLNSDVPTIYGKVRNSGNVNAINDLAEPADEIFIITKNVINLKGLFNSNDEILNIPNNYLKRNYSLELDKGNLISSTVFDVSIKIVRERDKSGVHRCIEPIIRTVTNISLQDGIKSYMNFYPVPLTDRCIVHLPLMNFFENYTIQFCEIYNNTNITNTAVQGDILSFLSTDEILNFVYLGAIQHKSISNSPTLQSYYINANLIVEPVYGFSSGTSAERRAQASKNIVAALKMKNPAIPFASMIEKIDDVVFLTHDEAQDAISNGQFNNQSIDSYYE